MRQLIYHTGDTAELADLIRKCLQIKGSDSYSALAAQGRKVYEENFTSTVFERSINKEIELASKDGVKGKLICMVGVYDILDIFMYELIKEFKSKGYEILLFDTSNMQESLVQLEPFI